MIIDLHVHTLPLSRDSFLEFPGVIEHAKQSGLDGICVTEHEQFWNKEELARLSEEHDFLLLPGIELWSDDNHFLVFGLEERKERMWMAYKLREVVDEAGAVMILAHPARWQYAEVNDMDEALERYCRQSFLKYVDIIEVLNGRLSDAVNEFQIELSRRMGFKGTGGSDAHSLSDIPSAATRFEKNISNLEDLITELKAGRFEAVNIRKNS
ncbi:PHP domain-containing protein [Chloroflexota bacterium]